MDDYLGTWVTAAEAGAWLHRKLGGIWPVARIIEYVGYPSVWIEWTSDSPQELFGDRYEGFHAPMIFAGDLQRLAFDGTPRMTMCVFRR